MAWKEIAMSNRKENSKRGAPQLEIRPSQIAWSKASVIKKSIDRQTIILPEDRTLLICSTALKAALVLTFLRAADDGCCRQNSTGVMNKG